MKDFHQAVWDDRLLKDWLRILDLAIAEDLGTMGDCTSDALIPIDARGKAAVVARSAGVLAGEPAIEPTLKRFSPKLKWIAQAQDGQPVARGQSIGVLEGPARAMLAAERPLLNLLGHLSGIASLTRRYVDLVAGTKAAIYDTRKTTPGWRSLEKYAVRCGGGRNHRSGLYEAVLIKDNHLALVKELGARDPRCATPAEAVVRARHYLETTLSSQAANVIVEVEVDTLDDFYQVLAARPDIILLDNMNRTQLAEAVAKRDLFVEGVYAAVSAAESQLREINPQADDPKFVPFHVELEASGGIDLTTVRGIAESGVERISVGALTHSAAALDFGLDWA